METDSSIVVTITSGSTVLSSTTVANMLNNYANLALIGNELVCFENVTFLGSGQYQLSGAWMRGIKGTAGVSHVAGERFILLGSPSSAVLTFNVAVSLINTLLYYRAGTIGASVIGAPVDTLTFACNKLKPFAPCMVRGTRDGSNNLTITWARRDRVYTQWIDNVDLQLSEGSLSFQVDIVNVSNVVVRTISVTAETATYTAAEQTSDGLTPGNPVKVRVYQISQAIGRGTGKEETI
jgi:hypothetical protein